MAEPWRQLTLGEVAQVVGGGTPSTKEPDYWGGDIPWVTPTEVVRADGKTISSSDRTITSLGLAKSSANLLPAGAVLLTTRASVGFTAIAAVPLATNQGFQSLVPGEGLDPAFLMLWIQANREEFRTRAGGSTFPEVSKVKVRQIPITIPPLEVQRRIVDLVGAIDVHLRVLAAEIQALGLVLQSMIEDWQALNEDETRLPALGDLAVIRSGPSWAAEEESALPSDGATRVIKITNTKQDGSLDLTGRTYVTGLPGRTLLLDDRSLIVIRTNGNRDRIGNVYRPSPEALGCAVSAFQFIVQATDSTTRDRIYWALSAPSAQAAMSDAASGTTGLGNLAAGWLKALPIAELNEQTRLAFEDTNRQLSLLRNEHEILRTVRTQLLQGLLSREVELPEGYDQLLDAGVA